jgi:hypothetical protein
VFIHAQSGQKTEENPKNTLKFYYTLPKNSYTLLLTVQKVSLFKGPFADYAERLSGLSYVIKNDSVCYQITSILLNVNALPDGEQMYPVFIPQKAGKKYHFDANGFLKENIYIADYQKNTLLKNNPTNSTPIEKKRFPLHVGNEFVTYYDTTYISQLQEDSTIISIPVITKRQAPKTTLAMAQDIIKTIEQIREQKLLLLTGDHETDYSQLPLMLTQLKEQEDEYTALFTGIQETENEIYTLYYCPTSAQKADILQIPLTGLENGKLLPNELNIYSLRLEKVASPNIMAQQVATTQEKGKKHYFYYRQPTYYKISLCKGNQILQTLGTFPLAQFGVVCSLPQTDKCTYKRDDFTGALKSVQFHKKKKKY